MYLSDRNCLKQVGKRYGLGCLIHQIYHNNTLICILRRTCLLQVGSLLIVNYKCNTARTFSWSITCLELSFTLTFFSFLETPNQAKFLTIISDLSLFLHYMQYLLLLQYVFKIHSILYTNNDAYDMHALQFNGSIYKCSTFCGLSW